MKEQRLPDKTKGTINQNHEETKVSRQDIGNCSSKDHEGTKVSRYSSTSSIRKNSKGTHLSNLTPELSNLAYEILLNNRLYKPLGIGQKSHNHNPVSSYHTLNYHPSTLILLGLKKHKSAEIGKGAPISQ
jgi:hypothetical protein